MPHMWPLARLAACAVAASAAWAAAGWTAREESLPAANSTMVRAARSPRACRGGFAVTGPKCRARPGNGAPAAACALLWPLGVCDADRVRRGDYPVAPTQAFKGQRAVVVGATKGIGRGIAMHLAREGATVLAASRSRERGEALVREMRAASPVGTATEGEGGWSHAYVPLDAFSLAWCAEFVEEVTARAERAGGHGGVDMLVLTQGMATLQGYTPTAEGLDEKVRV